MPREKSEQDRGVVGVMHRAQDLAELPQGWTWATLGDIGAVASGGTPSTKDADNFNGDIPWITPADLSGYDDKFINRGQRNISTSGLKASSAKILPAGTILFSSRAPIGYVAIASADCATNQGFKNLVVGSDIFNEYVYYFLKNSKDIAESLASGTTFLEISGKKFSLIPIPLAPTREQHRIVAKIEELFTKLDAGIKELRHAQSQLKRYRQSVLNAAVTGELTKDWREAHQAELAPASELLARILKERREKWEQDHLARMESERKTPKNNDWKQKYREPAALDSSKLPTTDGWCWIALELIAKAIDPQPSHRTPPQFDNGIPYVGMGDVKKDKKIDLKNARKVSPNVLAEHRERYQLKEGDFFIGKIGTIGKPVKLFPPFDYALSANIVLIQPNPAYTAETFAFLYMSSPLVESLLVAGSRATTQSAFGIQKVRLLPYPLPPLAEQRKIVEEVQRSLSICEATENAIEQSLKQTERMRQSILKHAFEGKLVPQDASDEPAETLLERIKIERAMREAEKSAASKPDRGPFKKKRNKRTQGVAA